MPEPSVDDNQRYDLAPTPFDELLQILIQDLEGKDYAIKATVTVPTIPAALPVMPFMLCWPIYIWDQDYDTASGIAIWSYNPNGAIQ